MTSHDKNRNELHSQKMRDIMQGMPRRLCVWNLLAIALALAVLIAVYLLLL